MQLAIDAKPRHRNDCRVTTIAERLDRALAHAGLTQTQVEREAELNKGYLSRPLKGTRKRLDPEAIVAIARVCGVRSEWLASGSGSMVEGERPMSVEPHVEREETAPESDDESRSALDAALRRADAGRHDRMTFDLARRAAAEIQTLVIHEASVDEIAAALLRVSKNFVRSDNPRNDAIAVAQLAIYGARGTTGKTK